MSRKQLEDEILYQRRYLNELENTVTNCLSCGRMKYDKSACMKHGPVPGDFQARTDCPDWEFEAIPF